MNGFQKNLGLSIDLGKLEPYKAERVLIINSILQKINSSSHGDNFVLKGGTGLLLCHGLDRFSEDIDLDGIRRVDIQSSIIDGCASFGKIASIRVAKDTDTVLRYLIDYQSIHDRAYPLKLEISYRNKPLLLKKLHTVKKINGIRVYSIQDLVNMKLVAFINRDKARDFYDLYWCSKFHPEVITENMAAQILEALHFKGVEEMTELLKEETSSDHILSNLDTSDIMIEFLYNLDKLSGAEVGDLVEPENDVGELPSKMSLFNNKEGV